MRSIILLGAILGVFSYAQAQTARVQVIHNAPSPTVDVYANGDLLLDDFVFRTATPFVDVPAEVEIVLAVAPGNSASADDAIASFPVTLADGGTYVVVAAGLVGGDPVFDLKIFDMGMEAAPSSEEVSILFFHGSPDAPTVDIVAGGSPIFDDVSFGEFGPYVTVPADAYEIGVTPADDNDNVLLNYDLDVDFWAGNTMVVFASGFLGDSDPGFEPWVALSNGGTYPLMGENAPDPVDETMARVQIIHNAPAPTVDVYANADKLVDNFVFRTATPYVSVPAGVEIQVGIAPADSDSADDAIATFPATFEGGKTYVVVATGIVGGDPGFDLAVFDMSTETSDDPANVSLLFYHGSPDAPTVDIVAGGSPIFDDVMYGQFSGPLNVPAATYELAVTPGDDNETVVAAYEADFGFWAGKSAVVFASGFLSGDDPAFAPWVALSTGGTYPLRAIDPEAPGLRIPVGSGGLSTVQAELFPNPATQQLNVKFDLQDDTRVWMELWSLSGQVVYQQSMGVLSAGSQLVELPLAGNLTNGQYLLRIRTANDQLTYPLMIQK